MSPDTLPFALDTDATAVRQAAEVLPGLVLSVAENFPIQQLEGRECVLCEQPIVPGQELRPIWMDSHFDLYAHEHCEDGEQL